MSRLRLLENVRLLKASTNIFISEEDLNFKLHPILVQQNVWFAGKSFVVERPIPEWKSAGCGRIFHAAAFEEEP